MIMKAKPTVKSEIERAFIHLLLEKDYSDITVSDLVNRAQVARMSFYRNFRSLDDVVESISDKIIQEFIPSLIPALTENSERKWREYLLILFSSFIQAQSYFKMTFARFEKEHAKNHIVISRVQEKIEQIENNLPVKTVREKYVAIGKISLVSGIITKWALIGMQEPAEEVIDLIISIIMKL